MNKELAWVLGYLLSDGCIQRPADWEKGDERPFEWTMNMNDREVPFNIPEDIIGYERHFMRGLVDGSGTLHFRKDRKSFRIKFHNGVHDIVLWFANTLSELIGIPNKEPKFRSCDNMWVVEWEGRIARYLAWFLYHGDIDHCVLRRKKDYYRKYVLENKSHETHLEELLNALGLALKDKRISMKTRWEMTLDWCKILMHVIKEPCVPVPIGKGRKKYYELYLPNS